MSDPKRLTEDEIKTLVFRAATPSGSIFDRYEVGNLLATLFATEKERNELAEALVRECLYYTHPDHPNEDGWYTCSHCHVVQIDRKRVNHEAHCVVEKARKYG